MEKVGIMGGTFDPVHYGHIYLAQQARDEGNLAKVIFVPAKVQPFKQDRETAPASHRLEMLKLAVADRPKLEVSDYEVQSLELSYTINTLRGMKKRFGSGCQLFFVIGTDAFLKVNIWKNAEELLRDYSFMVGNRPGYRETELKSCIEQYRDVYNTNVMVINNRQVPISSTEIRARLMKSLPLSDLVPENVERYIKENGLYKELY